MNFTPDNITRLEPDEIFVFGSNMAGRHGAGAAKTAVRFGAKYGCGSGHFGQTYAIPTKDENLRTLPASEIAPFVKRFIAYAETLPKSKFLVTPIGCGLAGHKVSDIAPMFSRVPDNVILPIPFIQL